MLKQIIDLCLMAIVLTITGAAIYVLIFAVSYALEKIKEEDNDE